MRIIHDWGSEATVKQRGRIMQDLESQAEIECKLSHVIVIVFNNVIKATICQGPIWVRCWAGNV